MRVRLMRKLATEIDGVDLSGHDVGDVVDLPAATAKMLVAEGGVIREDRGAGTPTVVAFRRATDPGHTHDEEFE
jgi:hypothetical protein